MTDPARLVVLLSGLYVFMLLAFGVAGRRSMSRRSLSEHFLAGRSIGFTILLLTLFATQYSGNSLSGFPGKTYRAGLSYIMSVTFMTGVVTGYLLFVPKLYALARTRRYLTPTDFLADRFASPALNYASAAIFAVALGNFLLAQLMAMGHAVSGLSQQQIPYWGGVVGGAIIILVYESLGGLRAVAWTDALQGLILVVGLIVVVGLIIVEIGSPADIVAVIATHAPEKVANPSWQTCRTWLSTFLLLALGAPLYPQAIQRIYAARQRRELQRALAVMAFLPLFAITTVVFIGATGLSLFSTLGTVESDEVTFRVLAHLVEIQPQAAIPVILVLMAVLAAIMSTADSALLSLVSITTKDFIARIRGLNDDASERLLRWAPWQSLLIVIGLGAIALQPRLTLWRLLEIKFEVLIQLSPAFVLGTLSATDEQRRFEARDILCGLVVGLATALGLYAAGAKLGGFHPGTIGVVANYLTVFASRALRKP